jgi:hypothetical protein
MMNFKVLISSPLKWHPSLIVQIKKCLEEGRTSHNYWTDDFDSAPDYNFVGVVTHLEGGGRLIRPNDCIMVGETSFEYVDRTEVSDGGNHCVLTCNGAEITIATRAYAETFPAYQSLRQGPFPWIVEEKANGKIFFCMWDWREQKLGAPDEVVVIQFMADFVARVKSGSLVAPFHK